MSEKAEKVATEKRHAAAMSDALFRQGCLAVGLSSTEIAWLMKSETDELEGSPAKRVRPR